MNCRNFLQFEIMKPGRMVGMGGPEAPAVVPAEVEKPKEEPKEPVLRQPEQNAEQNRQKREIESAERVEAEKNLRNKLPTQKKLNKKRL